MIERINGEHRNTDLKWHNCLHSLQYLPSWHLLVQIDALGFSDFLHDVAVGQIIFTKILFWSFCQKGPKMDPDVILRIEAWYVSIFCMQFQQHKGLEAL